MPAEEHTSAFGLFQYCIEPLEPRTLLAAVGPDTYGYIANAHPVESINLVPGNPGVTTLLTNVDDATAPVDLGANTFNFYGNAYTSNNSLFVSSNGLITFRSGDGSARTGDLSDAFITGGPAQPAIVALWDDWYGSNKYPSQIVSEIDKSNGNDRLIVQWHTFHIPHSPVAITFQAILQLNTGDQPGEITFNYPNIDTGDPTNADGANAVTGIKDAGIQGDHRLLISEYGSNPLVANDSAILISNVITQWPHTVITAPATIDEGMTALLDASSSTDPTQSPSTLTYAWGLDGDGIYGETGDDAPLGDEVGIHPTFISPELASDKSFRISLHVTDAAGLVSSASTTITVHHILPQLTVIAPAQVLATVPAVFNLSGAPEISSYDYAINWGDSGGDFTTDQRGNSLTATHTYDQPGSYTVSVTATNDLHIASNPLTLQVTVAARPAQLLTSDGVLILTMGDADNSISIDDDNSNLRLNLNSIITNYPLANVKSLDIQTGNGNNLINANVDLSQKITTGAGNETITTGDADDTIFCLAGNDSISTNGGEDSILVGNGNDSISAGDGNDTVVTDGDPRLNNNTTIDGGAGDDLIGATNPGAPISGGDGDDTIRIHSDANHPALVFGGDGNDRIFTTDGRDTIYGQGGSDFLYGGNGNDFLSGGAGSDHLFGQGGNDRLFGDSGYDHLNGQGGNDTLSGGPNADHLNGGNGDNVTSTDDPLDQLMNIQSD